MKGKHRGKRAASGPRDGHGPHQVKHITNALSYVCFYNITAIYHFHCLGPGDRVISWARQTVDLIEVSR